jgi:hypothetical protein
MKNKKHWKQVVFQGEPTRYWVSKSGLLYDSKKDKQCKTFWKWTHNKKQENLYEAGVIKLDSGEYKNIYIHRLVAEAWCKKPEGTQKWVVDHIDENTRNNNYTNLQWLTSGQNVAKSLSKRVRVWEYNFEEKQKGRYLGVYPSVSQTARIFNLNTGNIIHTINKIVNHTGGYVIEWL